MRVKFRTCGTILEVPINVFKVQLSVAGTADWCVHGSVQLSADGGYGSYVWSSSDAIDAPVVDGHVDGLAPGDYTITARDDLGCEASTEVSF